MSGWRVIPRALASAVLAMPVVAVLPPPAAAQGEQGEVPCPRVEVDPPPEQPPPPDPPEHGPGEPELGGVALATAGLAAPADVPQPPALTAASWLVADLDTGTVLGGCGPHEYGIPASTLKLLLVATFLDELDPEREVEVVQEDLDIEPFSSAVGVVPGGVYTVETLWLGLLLNSGNEVANVLARVGGGQDGLEGGLRAMNEEAERLGAFQTYAATPSGLDGPGQFTSAYDLALIARPLFRHDDFLRYVRTERTDIPAQPDADPPAGGFQIQNDNRLLFNYPGALGGKTGFTNLARHSFVGAAERDGRRLVVTLLGAERTPLAGWEQAAELLDWGFSLPANAQVGQLVAPEDIAPQTSSTRVPTAPPAAAAPTQATGQQRVGAVNAGTVAAVLASGGVTGLVVLALVRRRRRT